MGKIHVENNKRIAQELGITFEMVQYMRPRLLGTYKGDVAKLIESIKKHKQNALETNPRAQAALEKNKKLAAKPSDPHKELHEKRILHHTGALAGLNRNIPLYDSLVIYLENITPEQKAILLKI